MISCTSVRKPVIRSHYNLTTPFYRLLWGHHLHHGLFEEDVPAKVAQQQLTDRLAQEANIQSGDRVLDVGCGMGGSSIALAQALDCRVTGITLSPVQRHWAQWASRWHGVQAKTDFRAQDAETAEFQPGSFDIVWSIECTEHLFEKPAFFKRPPNGSSQVAAWPFVPGWTGTPMTPTRPLSKFVMCVRDFSAHPLAAWRIIVTGCPLPD